MKNFKTSMSKELNTIIINNDFDTKKNISNYDPSKLEILSEKEMKLDDKNFLIGRVYRYNNGEKKFKFLSKKIFDKNTKKTKLVYENKAMFLRSKEQFDEMIKILLSMKEQFNS